MFTGARSSRWSGCVARWRAAVRCRRPALLLGTRNTLYGLRLAPLLRLARRGGAWPRAHLVIDESTAMAVTRDDPEARPARLPGDRRRRSSCCGTSPRWSARSPATPSATRAPTASTPPSAAAFLALLWPRLRDPRNRLVGRAGRGRRPRAWCRFTPGRRPGARRRRRRLGRAARPVAPRPDRAPEATRDLDRRLRRRRRVLPAQAGRAVGPGSGCWTTRSVERIADLIPVALLSALVAVQVFSTGHRAQRRRPAAGLAAAVVALLLRAPFLVVVVGRRAWRPWLASSGARSPSEGRAVRLRHSHPSRSDLPSAAAAGRR